MAAPHHWGRTVCHWDCCSSGNSNGIDIASFAMSKAHSPRVLSCISNFLSVGHLQENDAVLEQVRDLQA